MTTGADKRLDFIENYCTLSLHVKPDKWSKFATSEETHTMLNEFYEKQDVTTLVITLNPTGQLIPCLGFPSTLKNKGIYFVKKRRENITKDNFQEALIVGDISPSPVEQMMAIVEEVGFQFWFVVHYRMLPFSANKERDCCFDSRTGINKMDNSQNIG